MSDNDFALLHSISINGKVFFIQARFLTDKSCSILITDIVKCWQSVLTAAVIAQAAKETSTELIQYYELMKSALCGINCLQKFHYDVSQQADGSLSFEWKKIQKNVKFCMGKFVLTTTVNPRSDLINILLTCCTSFNFLNSSLEESKLAYTKLQKRHQDLSDDLERCAHLKENLQAELMAKFVLVINAKKAKIRSLREELSQSNICTNNEVEKAVVEDETLASDIATTSVITKRINKLNIELDDDTAPVLPKRKRATTKQPVPVSLSPIRSKDIGHISPVKFPSDVNTTTSSDSTVDINELLEDV